MQIQDPTKLSDQDRDLMTRLALPPSNIVLRAAKKYRTSPCLLLENQIALNLRGEVQLCCAVFDQAKYTVADFLSTPLDDIRQQKRKYSICDTCMNNGLHVLACYGSPEFDEIAFNNVTEFYRTKANLSLHLGRSGFKNGVFTKLLKEVKRVYRRLYP